VKEKQRKDGLYLGSQQYYTIELRDCSVFDVFKETEGENVSVGDLELFGVWQELCKKLSKSEDLGTVRSAFVGAVSGALGAVEDCDWGDEDA
jgi:hypothetical protein